jgi:hypothetical protein
MPSSFKYQIQGTPDALRIKITHRRWPVFFVTLSLSFLVLLALFQIYGSRWRDTVVGFSFSMLGIFLACVLCYMAFHSILSRTISASLTHVQVRSSWFGIAKTRSFPHEDVLQFGFGLFGHSLTPVLRLEVLDRGKYKGRTEWICFATGTTEAEVNDFLRVAESRGFRLPRQPRTQP